MVPATLVADPGRGAELHVDLLDENGGPLAVDMVGNLRTTTDQLGGTRVETYFRDGRLKEVSGTAASPVKNVYGVDSVAGVPCEFTKTIRVGPGGAETEWTKAYTDPLGRPFLTVHADAAQSRSFYNDKGQLWKTVDPDGVANLYGYNAEGEREVSAVDLNANDTIDYGVDRIARTVSDVAVRTTALGDVTVGRTRTWVWREGATTENDGTLVSTSETSADGAWSWHSSFGRESSTSTEINAVTRTRTVTSVAPDGTSTVARHQDGRLVAVESYDANDVLLTETTYSYDAHGRQQTVVRNPGAATEQTTTHAYVAGSDQIASATVAAGGISQTTSYAYDALGRRTQTTLPGNVVQHADYDAKSQVVLTYGDGQYPVEYAYDPQGRMVAMTTWKDFNQGTGEGTAGSATTLWLYSPLRGWLDRKQYDDGHGTDYAYTPAGRLASRTWARLDGQSPLVALYAYDAAGQQTLVDYSDATPDVATTYRRDGSPATVADASGTRTFAYNADGSPDSITYATGPLAGYSLDYAQDALGRPLGYILADGTGTVAEAVYSYDAAGRLGTVADGANAFAYGYAPGVPNQVATVTANNGTANVLTTTKTYDGLDRLLSISAAPSSALQAPSSAHTYAYNARNQRTRATLADDSYWDYTYDTLGQVIGGVKYNAAGTPIPGMAFGYVFDHIGNRTTSTENGHQTTYAANLLNQYTARAVPGIAHVRGAASTDAIVTARPTVDGAPVAPPTQSQRLGETFFVPLPVDNTAAPFVGAAEITAVLPGAAPGGEDIVATEARPLRIPQATQALTYDLDGNLTSDGIWQYEWNAENRLVSTAKHANDAKIEYAYDSQGRRFRKTSYSGSAILGWTVETDTYYLYDGWNLIAELDANANNTPIRTHLWGTDLSGTMQGAGGVGGLLSSTRHQAPSTTHTRFACYDGNGNVTAYVDANTGAKSAAFDYDPFGNTVVAEGDTLADLPFRFSTKYTDQETRLLYYGYRYYCPDLGRWLNRDPIGEVGGVNLLGFVNNYGLNAVDLHGLEAVCFNKGKAYWQVHRRDGTVSKAYQIGRLVGANVHLEQAFGTFVKHQETVIATAATFNSTFGYIDTIDEAPRKAIVALWLKWGFVPPFFSTLDQAGIWGSWLCRGKAQGNNWEYATWIRKLGSYYVLNDFVTSGTGAEVRLWVEDPIAMNPKIAGWVHNHPAGGEGMSTGDRDSQRMFKNLTDDDDDPSIFSQAGYAVSPKGYVFKTDGYPPDVQVFP